ncbi:MAG: hypothetical protein ACXVMS_06815 [Flavisolibacter sp.]
MKKNMEIPQKGTVKEQLPVKKDNKEKGKEARVFGREKPMMKWQVEEFDRHAEYKFILPIQFLLLCKLLDVTPHQVLLDFMDNAAQGSWKRQGREAPREKVRDYFLSCGYGQEHYPESDIREIFQELDAMGRLWPGGAKRKLVDLHAKWRDKYYPYWFRKWHGKPRRKL